MAQSLYAQSRPSYDPWDLVANKTCIAEYMRVRNDPDLVPNTYHLGYGMQ